MDVSIYEEGIVKVEAGTNNVETENDAEPSEDAIVIVVARAEISGLESTTGLGLIGSSVNMFFESCLQQSPEFD